MLAAVSDLPETAEASSNLSDAQPFITISVDRALAAAAGLSEVAVGGIVTDSMLPAAIGSVVIDEKTLSIYIDDPRKPLTVQQLRDFSIPERARADPALGGRDGRAGERPGEHHDGQGRARRDGERHAERRRRGHGVRSVSARRSMPSTSRPGADAELGGVTAQQSDAFTQLGLALLVAILIVYVVMVATFKSLRQPLLLLVSVPFAATGAILLQVVSGIPLGVPSLIGVLMLVGIVVTNAIVLVDLINQYRERGLPHGRSDHRGRIPPTAPDSHDGGGDDLRAAAAGDRAHRHGRFHLAAPRDHRDRWARVLHRAHPRRAAGALLPRGGCEGTADRPTCRRRAGRLTANGYRRTAGAGRL